MGLLDKAIKKGIGSAVGNAVGNAVGRAVAPKVEDAAAKAVNRAADSISQTVSEHMPERDVANVQPRNRSSVNNEELNQAMNTLGGLFGSMQGAATNFANEAAKNMKICPACGDTAGADTKFCPSCGGAMPTETVAQGAICTSCGKENNIGTKFCADCGAKLPSALAEESAAAARNDAVMARWDAELPQYPKWSFGGKSYSLEQDDYGEGPVYRFNVEGTNRAALQQYRDLLKQNGFREAGQYPTIDRLFKMVGSTCYCVDSSEPFPSEEGWLQLYFLIREPSGGFNYTKPEPQAKKSLFDLFK